MTDADNGVMPENRDGCKPCSPMSCEAWSVCQHVWGEIESMFTNEYRTDVRCVKCRCPGERDNVNGSVFWPAT